jgi:hypothetical protein
VVKILDFLGISSNWLFSQTYDRLLTYQNPLLCSFFGFIQAKVLWQNQQAFV